MLQAADLLKAPMVHTVRSKDIIDNANQHYAGGIGFKGSKNGCHYVEKCDDLLVVGCSFAWRQFYPKGVPIIQIDVDPQRIGVRCTVSVGLVGEAKLTLAALNALLTAKTNDKFLKGAEAPHHKSINTLDKQSEAIKAKGISSPL